MAAADADIVPLWDEWAGEGVTPFRPSDTFPQIKKQFGGSYAVRVFCFDGQSQMLMELRDWLMSAGDEWAGEGVLTLIYKIRGCP